MAQSLVICEGCFFLLPSKIAATSAQLSFIGSGYYEGYRWNQNVWWAIVAGIKIRDLPIKIVFYQGGVLLCWLRTLGPAGGSLGRVELFKSEHFYQQTQV